MAAQSKITHQSKIVSTKHSLYVISHSLIPDYRKIIITTKRQNVLSRELNQSYQNIQYPGKWLIERVFYDIGSDKKIEKISTKLTNKLNKKFEYDNSFYRISKYKMGRKIAKVLNK